MDTGESVTFAFLTTNTGTPYYHAVTIDGSSVTPEWQGGCSFCGNASSYTPQLSQVMRRLHLHNRQFA